MNYLPAFDARAKSVGLALVLGAAISQPAAAGEYGPLPVGQSSLDWMKNCLIYTTDMVDIPGPFKIFKGTDDPDTYRSDVCAVNAMIIGGTKGVAIPKDADNLSDVALAGTTITLSTKSKSSDCVYDTANGGGLIDDNAQVICPSQQDVDLSVMPTDLNAVIPFPTITIPLGAPDIHVGLNETFELYLNGPCTPSADAVGCAVAPVGNIVLESKSTLRLMEAGDYQVLSLATISGSPNADIIVMQEGTSLLVKGAMKMGHRSLVNPDNTPLFKIYVEGDDSLTTANWTRTEGFDYRGDGTFNACFVYSPNATQVWRGKPNRQKGFTTQVFAKNFEQNQSLNVVFEHPQDPNCFAPEYGCPCLSQNEVPMTCSTASGIVRVEANNATPETVSHLLFMQPGTALAVDASVDELIAQACFDIPSADLGFDATLKNSITTPDIFTYNGGIAATCGSNVQLVPVAVGPDRGVPQNTALCYSEYHALRLTATPSSCAVVSPAQ